MISDVYKRQLTTTVATPAGATLVTRTYYDGTTTLQGGTGQREMETQLELTGEGSLTTTLSKGVVLSRSLENGFGQTIRQEQPNTKICHGLPYVHISPAELI